ncbi:uncharacterized protein [Chanodichthys erythropterus]|uniref:uncharacterized protein isoform X2 n=1 Tax=Chanodichthys erythropterus TaxID=933992 RepID=UPI00351DFF4A
MASSSGNRSLQRQHKDLPDEETTNMTAVSDLRIVLLGKNITENNRVGNFILGRAAFESEAPADVELNIEKHRGKLKDRDVTVINTPHLLRPNLSITQITQGVKECVNLSAPGPRVIILVLQQNDFSDNNRHRVKYVLNEFSKEALKHTIVLTDEEEIHNNAIHQLIQECGDEHLQFEERKSGLHSEILERVEKILKENQVQFLISDLYEEAGEETPEDGEKRRSGGSVTAEEEGDFDHEVMAFSSPPVKPRKTLASNDGFLTSSRTVHISNWMIIGLGVLLIAALIIILPTQYTECQSEQLKMKEQAEDLIKLQQEITELKIRNTELMIMEEQQKAAEKQDEDLIKELKQEITELKRRNTEQEKRNTEVKMMEEQQKAAEKQAEDLIKELKQEITELKKRNTELEQFSHTDDHPDVIQPVEPGQHKPQGGIKKACQDCALHFQETSYILYVIHYVICCILYVIYYVIYSILYVLYYVIYSILYVIYYVIYFLLYVIYYILYVIFIIIYYIVILICNFCYYVIALSITLLLKFLSFFEKIFSL